MPKVDESSVANPGLVRPPVVYLLAVLAGLVIDHFWSIALPFGVYGLLLGVSALIAAVTLIILTQREFRTANTPIPGNRPATSVVQTGPLRISRNPIYLSFSLAGFGVAFWFSSIWIFITLTLAHGVMQFVVIPREERYMEAKFGPEYSAYKSSVRRWI